MKWKKYAWLLLFIYFGKSHSQFVIYSGADSATKLQINAYLDAYFNYTFSKPKDPTLPYLYAAAKHNELGLNLAFVNFSFENSRSRASFTPAIGSFMEMNYAAEPAFWQHVYEGYAGIKPLKKRNWWLDFGVFGSPYTNETAISYDQIIYTRSLGSENSPYYLSGFRSSHKINQKWNFIWYFLNGWQRIRKINDKPALGSSVEFKPNAKWAFSFAAYAGDSRYDSMPNLRTRYFGNINGDYNRDGKVSASFCLTAGNETHLDSMNNAKAGKWGSAALQLKWRFLPKHSVAVKYDMYADPQEIVVKNMTNNSGFQVQSFTLNYSLEIGNNALFRVEGRGFWGKQKMFLLDNGVSTRNNQMLVSSLALKF